MTLERVLIIKQKAVLFNTTGSKFLVPSQIGWGYLVTMRGNWRETRVWVAEKKGNLLIKRPGFLQFTALSKVLHIM